MKAKFRRPVDASRLSPTEQADLVIEPNEVVFVLSEESLDFPSDIFAILSPKRKMSEAGVLTLGGLAVDPGYKGRLLVGLLNFSSTPFLIKPGKKLVAATFYRMDQEETCLAPCMLERLEDFPDQLIDVMGKYSPVDTRFFVESLGHLKDEIGRVQRQLQEHDDWRKRLDRHDDQIDKLLSGLHVERQERIAKQDDFSKALIRLEKTLATIRGGAYVLYALVALILIPMLIELAKNLIK